MTGIILIGLGIILFIAGIIIIYKPTPAEAQTGVVSSFDTSSSNSKPILNNTASNVDKSKWANKKDVSTEENFRKGENFEKYVVKKFNREYFTIKEWTSDKYVDGIYAETNQHPDLVVELALRSKKKSFSIECKWKQSLYNNGIKVATEEQLNRYKKFELERGIPVFMAVGISGEPSRPKELYIIPLKELKNNFIHINDLKKYEKENIEEGFFFDMEEETLR
ncbi:hypothetical protein GCM10023183_35790 [Nibribacter koreensis]|uniref:Restriction endonuclease n=2 Tax=Nibribacter koreensis TaxID=1084519 RepID=A0ABP8G172_9BACT